MKFHKYIAYTPKLIFLCFNVYVFVDNRRIVIAKNIFIMENIDILILFRMLPIRFRYIEPFSRNYDLKIRLKKF